jgi:hypothetical protein
VEEAEAARKEHLTDSRQRQRAWLARDTKGKWRPKKVYRKATYKWLLELDAGMMSSWDFGLEFFHITPDIQSKVPAFAWPLCSAVLDCAGENLCGVSFLQRVKDVNFSFIPDPSHGVHNNLKLAEQKAGMKDHVHMSLIARNAVQAPYNEGLRYGQVYGAVSEVIDQETPEHFPLFVESVADMLRDRGWLHRIAEPGILLELWELFKDENPFRNRGGAENPGRFLGTRRQAAREDEQFTMRGIGWTYACLNFDFLHGEHLRRLRIRDDDANRVIPMQHPALQERAVRAAMCNVATLACLFYTDREQQVLGRIREVGGEVWDA